MGSFSRQPAGRLGDICSGHGCFPPTPIVAGSGNVSVNGRPLARQGDPVVAHGCKDCSPHARAIAGGAGSVLINGRPCARITDAVSCGGKVTAGSADVLVGDAPKNRNPITPAEWQAFMGRLTGAKQRPRTPHERAALAAEVAVRFRGPEGAVATWQEHYYRQLRQGGGLPAVSSLSERAQLEGLQRAVAEHRRELAPTLPASADAGCSGDTGYC